MRILLLGEYSNVHATLADGLRRLGHEVCVVSDGDGWKGYGRDVDVRRRSLARGYSFIYYGRLRRMMHKWRGYDVVQLINPVFLPLKAERHWLFYRYLRKHNARVFLGAFGMDHYWVKAGLDCHTFRYSDFNLGTQPREREDNSIWIREWLTGEKGLLNRRIAADCDGIVAGLYEYWRSYVGDHGDKLAFIPFPIRVRPDARPHRLKGGKLRFFIGIQRSRSSYKGTDVMLRALERTAARYPERCEVVRVENVPFAEYRKLLGESDVILDQLYSYTPAMNALEAMAQGLVCVGGGEPENYEILGESELRPIVNVLPDEADVYARLCDLIEHADRLPQLSQASLDYIARHHDHVKVARRYVDFWCSKA